VRPRKVGGWEPDDREQHELHELYRVARVALSGRHALDGGPADTPKGRRDYAINEFMRAHAGEPNVKFKWVYEWVQRNVGHLTMPVD
jgi:hypothetical protein